MRSIVVVETRDGQRHNSIDDARRHADKVYGEALSRISHQIIQESNKYQRLQEFLDANLDRFVEIKALRDDLRTWTDEEGSDRVWQEGESGRRGQWVENR